MNRSKGERMKIGKLEIIWHGKEEIQQHERMSPLNKRISYVANGFYGMETDEKGRFKSCSDKGNVKEKE